LFAETIKKLKKQSVKCNKIISLIANKKKYGFWNVQNLSEQVKFFFKVIFCFHFKNLLNGPSFRLVKKITLKHFEQINYICTSHIQKYKKKSSFPLTQHLYIKLIINPSSKSTRNRVTGIWSKVYNEVCDSLHSTKDFTKEITWMRRKLVRLIARKF
jgi:hypothetical protein